MNATENPVSVRNIAHSISPDGIPILTQQLRYPRMIHGEFMTHRVFSRNARSSRAAPSATFLHEAEEPYVPSFRRNQKGMQPGEPLGLQELQEAEDVWLSLAEATRMAVRKLNRIGVHKQWANRPLEWFGYIDVLVTSTFWTNFNELRTDESAQDEMRILACEMLLQRFSSTPRSLKPGEWHLPYISDDEAEEWGGLTDPTGMLRKLSVARCARLSIRPFDGNDTLEAELARYERLMVSRPVHASPAEHQATPDSRDTDREWIWSHQHGNFLGWRQYRKMIPGEAVWDKFTVGKDF